MSYRRLVKKFQKKMGHAYRDMKDWFSFHEPVLKTMKGTAGEILNRKNVISAALEYERRNPDSLLEDKNFDLTIYDRLLRDDRIKFGIDLKKTLILHVETNVIPASEDKKDIEVKDAVQKNFDDLRNPSFDDILDNLLDSMVYGHKEGELVWKMDEGMVWWDRVKFQHPILFDFEYDEKGNMSEVLYGYYYGSDTTIDRKKFEEKFIYMVYPYLKDGNWYGDSDLREIYPDWWSKFNIRNWRNEYIQGFGRPVPHVVYDKNKTEDSELTAMEDMLENWQDNMYVFIPGYSDPESGELKGKFTIDWVQIGGKENSDLHNSSLDRIDKAITRKLILPDKLGFTDDPTGSRAQSNDILQILVAGIERIHRRLEDVINPKIRQFVDINFGNVENYPIFKFQQIDESIERELLQMLLSAGVVDKREKWIRRYTKVPELNEQEKKDIEKAKEEDRKKAMDQFAPGGDNGDTNDNNDNRGSNNPNADRLPRREGERKKKEEMKVELKTSNAPVKFKQIEEQYNTYEEEFLDSFGKLYAKQTLLLVKQIEKSKAVENEDIGLLASLRIRKPEFKKLFKTYYFKLYLSGKRDSIDELKPRLKTELKVDMKAIEFQEEWLDRDFINRFLREFGALGALTKEDRKALKNLSDRAFIDAGELENTMTKIAERTVSSGIRNGLNLSTINEQVKQFMAEDKKRHSLTFARTNASNDYNSGRMNFFNGQSVKDTIEAFQYSAVIDTSTTPFCFAHDGQIIRKSDPDYDRINPPNHFNCRSLLIPVLITDSTDPDSFYYKYDEKFPTWGSNVNSDGERSNMGDSKVAQPAPGFGGI